MSRGSGDSIPGPLPAPRPGSSPSPPLLHHHPTTRDDTSQDSPAEPRHLTTSTTSTSIPPPTYPVQGASPGLGVTYWDRGHLPLFAALSGAQRQRQSTQHGIPEVTGAQGPPGVSRPPWPGPDGTGRRAAACPASHLSWYHLASPFCKAFPECPGPPHNSQTVLTLPMPVTPSCPHHQEGHGGPSRAFMQPLCPRSGCGPVRATASCSP